MSHRLLEICCADIDSVKAAKCGGADRIELCSALLAGGLTPSAGMIETAAGFGGITVNVLIRPREGDFIYNRDELTVMLRDISICADLGADGVVIGALNADGSIDCEVCRRLIDKAKSHGLGVTFHRAFDQCNDPKLALEQIITMGCDRLLTSGRTASALEGADLIAELRQMAAGNLTIMAGAGVTPDNAAEILKLTDVQELHASAKMAIKSQMEHRITGVIMGSTAVDDYSRTTTSAETVKRLAEIIHNF